MDEDNRQACQSPEREFGTEVQWKFVKVLERRHAVDLTLDNIAVDHNTAKVPREMVE